MLWDSLVFLPSSAVFMANISVFAILFTTLGLLCGAVLVFLGENIPEVEEEVVAEVETLTDIQEWAAAHDWIEVALPAHREEVWNIAPVRGEVPPRRLAGVPETVWGGASALSKIVEGEVRELFMGLKPQFQIRQDPSWMQI